MLGFELVRSSMLNAKSVDVVWDVALHDRDKCAFVRDNTGNLVELVERPRGLKPAGSGSHFPRVEPQRSQKDTGPAFAGPVVTPIRRS